MWFSLIILSAFNVVLVAANIKNIIMTLKFLLPVIVRLMYISGHSSIQGVTTQLADEIIGLICSGKVEVLWMLSHVSPNTIPVSEIPL